MKRLAVLLCFGLSCRPYVPPAAPDYDENCQPSDDFYVQLSRQRDDIEALGNIPTEPSEALAYCKDHIESRGWVLAEKGGDPETQWSHFSTTLGNTTPVVLLGADWDRRSIADQAEILCHEAVHTYQWERFGDAKFIPTYALNEGTLALEAPAYHVSLQVWKAQHPEGDVEAKAESYARNLIDKYKIVYIPKRCAMKQALDVILQENP